MTTRAEKIDGKQTFNWLLLAEIEMAPPAWGRPLRMGDVRQIAAGFDPDMVGAIAIWHRPELPAGRGRYVCIDGQHRCAALRLLGYDDQRVPCLLYDGLTVETAAELSLGLQERRNLHALDKHRAALAAHDRRAVEIDKILTYCHLELAYHAKATDIGRIAAIAAVTQVWDRMGAGLERVLTVCSRAWGGTSAGFGSAVLKLVMTVMAAHDGQVDDKHLAETLGGRSPAQWVARDVVPRRSLSSIAQDVIVEYNKKARGGNRLTELTPSQYEQLARRTPTPTVRGNIDVRQTSSVTTRRMRTRVKRQLEEKGTENV
jgi:hypothetical protein